MSGLPHISGGFSSHIEVAQRALRRQASSIAYQNLDLALDMLLKGDKRDGERLERLLALSASLQAALVEKNDIEGLRSQICPSEQGLIGRLIPSARADVELAERLIQFLEEGATLLEGSTGGEALRLQIAYLEQGYNLAMGHALVPTRIGLLRRIGELYLQLGGLVPVERCYEEAFKMAFICFNIAIDLEGESPDLFHALSRVEGHYLKRLDHQHLGPISWAERHVWEGKTPQHAHDAALIAERLYEYGACEAACRIYVDVVRYSRRFPFEGMAKLGARQLELSDGVAPRPDVYACQRRRQRLAAIRGLTCFLFDHYLGSGEVKRPDQIPPFALDAMREADLLPPEGHSLEELHREAPTIHDLQQLHGRLMADFSRDLFEESMRLIGPPPCEYALVGLGSLPRGEMGIFSDLDAIVVVARRAPKVISYFQRVASHMELAVMSLGETKCSFARFDHLKDRFCLDPALLHPGRTIDTSTRLLTHQREELESLRKVGSDLDPIRNALRLACPIAGVDRLASEYLERLGTFYSTEGQGEEMGRHLLARWSAPSPREGSFDAKQDLYRPITLLIDALAVKHGIPGVRTIDRLAGLRGHYPPRFIHLCQRALELACRLRLAAQVHYGEESERIYLVPAEEASPLLLSYDDHQTLCEIDRSLFEPLSRMRLAEGAAIDVSAFPPPPPVQAERTLLARLASLEPRDLPPRLPDSIFNGDVTIRRSALWNYLTHLPVAPELARKCWNYALDAYRGRDMLPDTELALLSRLLLGLDPPTPLDLVYGDLIDMIGPYLESSPDRAALHALVKEWPTQHKGRLFALLRRSSLPPLTVERLALLPERDGSRPHCQATHSRLDLSFLSGTEKATIEGVVTGRMQLSSDALAFFQALLKGKRGPYGRHSVDRLGSTFFKLKPEFPGREKGWHTLRELLTGNAFPPRELIQLKIGKDIHAITASQAVEGESLQVVLEESPERLKQIDPHDYGWGFLTTVIALPEDAKPDNQVVYQGTPGGPLHIADVDPERAFFKPLIKRLFRDKVQCKSVLLCFDQMLQSLDPNVREEFLSLHPAAILDRWLQVMEQFNHRATELFGEEFIDSSLRAESRSEIPFFIEPTLKSAKGLVVQNKGLLLGLYDRMRALQECLRAEPDIPLIDLLCRIERDLGARYRAALKGHENVLERFLKLTDGEYKRERGSSVSITKPLKGGYQSLIEYERHGWTVEAARGDLRHILAASTNLEDLRRDLIEGEGSILRTVNHPDASDAVVGSIDFSTLDDFKTMHVLSTIEGLTFRKLRLTNCSQLTPSLLAKITRYSPTLTRLELVGCSGLTQLGPDLPCSHLSHLDLRGCDALRRVDLQAPKLRTLKWGKAPLPKRLSIVAPPLHRLYSEPISDLGRLVEQTRPLSLHLPNGCIRPYRSIDPLQARGLDALRLADGTILYQSGPDSNLASLLKVASSLGLKTCSVESRSSGLKSYALCRPFDPKVDTFELVWKLYQKGLDPRRIDRALLQAWLKDESYLTLLQKESSPRAVAFLLPLVEEQHVEATALMALCLSSSDPRRSEELLHAAAERGNALARYHLGLRQLQRGKRGRAQELFTLAAEEVPLAKLELATMAYETNPQDPKARQILVAFAPKHPKAALYAGYILKQSNPAAAVRHFQSALPHHPEAKLPLAKLLWHQPALAPEISAKDVAALFTQCAREKDPEATFYLALCYLAGKGFNRCQSTGIRTLRTAAKMKSPAAMVELAWQLSLPKSADESLLFTAWDHSQPLPHAFSAAQHPKNREVRELLIAAAQLDHPEALYRVGLDHHEKKAYVQAYDCFRLAAAQNHPGALFMLGRYLDEGHGVPRDQELAFRKWEAAAALRETRAEEIVGPALLDGCGLPVNKAKGLAILKRCAERGLVDAQIRLAKHYLHSSSNSDGEAIHYLRMAARQEETWAMRKLGIRLVHSNSRSLMNEGYQYLLQLDKSAHPDVAHALGIYAFQTGKREEALPLFEEALAKEYKQSEVWVALCLDKLGKRSRRVARLMRSAAERKEPLARLWLGIRLWLGDRRWSFPKDQDEAIRIFRSLLQFADAQLYLGMHHEEQKHLDQAITCYREACHLGSKEAAEPLARLEQAEQTRILEARRRDAARREELRQREEERQRLEQQRAAEAKQREQAVLPVQMAVEIIEGTLDEGRRAAAFREIQRATETNLPAAWYHLGRCYNAGWGTEPNAPEALACFQKALQLGDERARVFVNYQE